MTSTPDLTIAALTRTFGDVTALDGAELVVERGELVSILGPSGCGKSTLLQVIAGHLAPDAGRIEIAGRTVADTARGIAVGPDRREVGMVFQEYALFPHLTALENVMFALGATRGVRARLRAGLRGHRADAQRRALELLDQFRIAELAHRHPNELSGGQQQRVAIARAIAQSPRLLLLDEPFCNLDAATREHVRSEIVGRLRETGITCLFVTHDQEEALAISDRVAVMQGGRVMQVDEPEALYRRPFCLEVAEFLGRTNLLPGVASGATVATEAGTFPLGATATGDVAVLVRPELIDVVVDADGPAVVTSREFRGHDVVYAVRLASGTNVWAHRPSNDMARLGDRVRLVPQPGQATLFHPPMATTPPAGAGSGETFAPGAPAPA